MHLYVYYEVALDDVPGLDARVRAMQASLHQPSARFALRRRAANGETVGDPQTWMEVYEDVDGAFDARLAAAVERHGLARSTGPRHVERFVDVD